MWVYESQKLKEDISINTYLKETFNRVSSYSIHTKPTEDEIVEVVKDRSLYGLVECYIHVSDAHNAKFEEITPVLKNMEVTRTDIDNYMRGYTEKLTFEWIP